MGGDPVTEAEKDSVQAAAFTAMGAGVLLLIGLCTVAFGIGAGLTTLAFTLIIGGLVLSMWLNQ